MDCEMCIHYSVCGMQEKYKDLRGAVTRIVRGSADPEAKDIYNHNRFFRPTLLCNEYREEGD